MKVSEAFLVNTKNFESIIETLANYDADDIIINSDLLERLSFSDPNDLLVIRILKDFSIIDNDGKPAKYFEEFQSPETTKIALAKGLLSAYEEIFDEHPHIHQQNTDDIKEVFETHFSEKKTDLIIKYISRTFQKIVAYVGSSTIDKVLKDAEKEHENDTVAVETSQESSNNHQQVNSENKHEPFVSAEEISNNGIDDFLGSFNKSNSDTTKEDPMANIEENEVDSSSIEEFINDIENLPFEENEEDLVEDDQPKSTSEEPHEDSEEDDIFNFEEESFEDDESTPKTKNEDSNTDINPTDLEIPMSRATKSTNAMQNSTKEHQFVQKALIRKSDLLHKMKRWEELVPTLEEIISRYDGNQETNFKGAIDRTIIRRAIALLKLGKNDEALPALTKVINRFKDSNNNEFYEQASKAMLYKVNILEKKNAPSNELLQLYTAIIDRMGASSELILKEKLDEIHCKRFDLLINEHEDSVVLDASKKLIDRFKDSSNYQDYLQKAMIVRAETLDNMGEDEAALQAYDEFLTNFGNL